MGGVCGHLTKNSIHYVCIKEAEEDGIYLLAWHLVTGAQSVLRPFFPSFQESFNIEREGTVLVELRFGVTIRHP